MPQLRPGRSNAARSVGVQQAGPGPVLKQLAVIVVSQRLNGIKPAQPALTFKTLSFS